jgi:hypothetical protein
MFHSSTPYSAAATQAAQSDASAAQADARDARAEAEVLRQDVNRLLMITEALWTLLKKQHGYSENTLTDLVNEIDLRDGRLDGKVAKASPTACPGCGKMNSPKRIQCIYCGKPLARTLFAG